MSSLFSKTFAIGALSLLATVTAHAESISFSQKPFTDVPKGSAYYPAVEYLRTLNVVKGYLDGTFRPNARLTRAEFVAIMTNTSIINQARTNDCVPSDAKDAAIVMFSDVHAGDWFAEDVCFANQKDIIHGYPDRTFKPNKSISFVEAAKIAARVFALDVRKDNPADEKWYAVYVQTLANLKAIPRTIARFDQPITRAEMAIIIYRLKVPGDIANGDFATYAELSQ